MDNYTVTMICEGIEEDPEVIRKELKKRVKWY
jgi:hypothetical protein